MPGVYRDGEVQATSTELRLYIALLYAAGLMRTLVLDLLNSEGPFKAKANIRD